VRELVEEILRHCPGEWVDASDPAAVHEANLLQLSIDKAGALLGWSPVWGFAEAIRATIRWYFDVSAGAEAGAGAGAGARGDSGAAVRLTRDQITAYTARARELGLLWAGAVPGEGTHDS
jgi:CDP-glucose 4,6-dehydratase